MRQLGVILFEESRKERLRTNTKVITEAQMSTRWRRGAQIVHMRVLVRLQQT